MCVICAKPAKVKLERKIYEECFKNNGDGAGIAYVKDKKLWVRKGYFDFNEFYDECIAPNEELELLIHFRVASPGMVINQKMCHPFPFKSTYHDEKYDFALVHNGRIEYPVDKDGSDTSCFTRDVVAPALNRDPWFLDSELGIWMMNKIINPMSHNKSKLAIMRYNIAEDKVDTIIVGKKLGVTAHGCWFSNDSYLPPFKVVHGHYGGYMGGYGGEDGEMWTHKYVHKQVNGKWMPYLEWSAILKVEREKILASNPRTIPNWDQLTLAAQDQILMERCGFDASKERKTLKPIKLEAITPKKLPADFDISKINQVDPKMKWLSKGDRSRMRRIAMAYCRNAVGVDIDNWKIEQMLNWLRHDFAETEAKFCKQLTTEQLDKYILACDDNDPSAWAGKEPADVEEPTDEELRQAGFSVQDFRGMD